ncbi:unnamed protein product [Prorocentrum cordatum]|uniref:Uncharacterized protein n=1 Tax=Prorocentrum cordatum TaxID=2364126 RepID=A0ABN9UKA7_9DINO|nr:unnamed protein product [Polarella glacialis]
MADASIFSSLFFFATNDGHCQDMELVRSHISPVLLPLPTPVRMSLSSEWLVTSCRLEWPALPRMELVPFLRQFVKLHVKLTIQLNSMPMVSPTIFCMTHAPFLEPPLAVFHATELLMRPLATELDRFHTTFCNLDICSPLPTVAPVFVGMPFLLFVSLFVNGGERLAALSPPLPPTVASIFTTNLCLNMLLMRLVLRLPPTAANTSMKNYCLNPFMMRPTVAIICKMCLCLSPLVVCIVLPLTLTVAIICFKNSCVSSFVMSFLLPLPPPVATNFFKNVCLNPFVMSFVPTPPLLVATICVKSFSLNLIVMTTVLPPSPTGLRMNLIVLTIALPLPPTVATICMKNVDLNPFVWSRWQPPPPTVATTAGLPLVPRVCVEPIFSASAAAARPLLGWQSPWWIPTPPFMMLHVLRPAEPPAAAAGERAGRPQGPQAGEAAARRAEEAARRVRLAEARELRLAEERRAAARRRAEAAEQRRRLEEEKRRRQSRRREEAERRERQKLRERAASLRDRQEWKAAKRRARGARRDAKDARRLKALSREVQRADQRAADLRQSEEEAMQRVKQEEQRLAASGAAAAAPAAQRQRAEVVERRAAERHARLEAVARDRQKLMDKCAKIRERSRYKKEKAKYKDQKLSAKTSRRLSAVERAQRRLEEKCAAAREWEEEARQRRQTSEEQLAARTREHEQAQEERLLIASAKRLEKLRRREEEVERKKQEADEKAAARQRQKEETEQRRRELAESARAEKQRRREEADAEKRELARRKRAEKKRRQQAAADVGREESAPARPDGGAPGTPAPLLSETAVAALLGAAGTAGWASLLALALRHCQRRRQRSGDTPGNVAGAHRRVLALAQRARPTQRCGWPQSTGPPLRRALGVGELPASGLGAAPGRLAGASLGAPRPSTPPERLHAPSHEGAPSGGCSGGTLPRLGGPAAGPLASAVLAEAASGTPLRSSPRWHSRQARLSAPPRGLTIDGWDAFFDEARPPHVTNGCEAVVRRTSSGVLPSERSCFFIGDDDSAESAGLGSPTADPPCPSSCSARCAPETPRDSSSEEVTVGRLLSSPPSSRQRDLATSSLRAPPQEAPDAAGFASRTPTPTGTITAHGRRRWRSHRTGVAAGIEPNAHSVNRPEAASWRAMVVVSSAVAPARRRRPRAPEVLASPPASPPALVVQHGPGIPRTPLGLPALAAAPLALPAESPPGPPELAAVQLAPLAPPVKACPGRSSASVLPGIALRSPRSPPLRPSSPRLDASRQWPPGSPERAASPPRGAPAGPSEPSTSHLRQPRLPSPALLAASPGRAGPSAPGPEERADALPEPGPEPGPGLAFERGRRPSPGHALERGRRPSPRRPSPAQEPCHASFYIGGASTDEEPPSAEAQGPASEEAATLPGHAGPSELVLPACPAALPSAMQSEVERAKAALCIVRLACVELHASTRFRAATAMLQGAASAALGSPAAPSFALEGLLQLADARGASGFSVVHYVCLECRMADPGFLRGLLAELRHVPLVAKAAGTLAGIPEQASELEGVARAALSELAVGCEEYGASSASAASRIRLVALATRAGAAARSLRRAEERTRAAAAACGHFLGQEGSEATAGRGLDVGAIVLAGALLQRFEQAWREAVPISSSKRPEQA